MFDFCSFPCKGRKDSLEIYKPSYNKNKTYPNSHSSEVSLVKGFYLSGIPLIPNPIILEHLERYI